MSEPIHFGKYLLLERINVGGMAEVFKAKAFGVEGFERILAIKRILPTMAEDEEFINMFIDEARIAVQLTHANIVPVFELGRLENQYYIAMEYVAGRDLRQILDRFRKKDTLLPEAASAYITTKICEGLDYAHRKTDAANKPLNLIHRDVSPQNILVGYEGAIKITDFGIVKADDRTSKTQAGVLKGKFAYMSPEQVRGLEIDHRSDIFAVGILLYEMATGKRLFVGESDFQTLERVRAAEVQPPREVNPALSEGFEKVILKALARERDERYAHASELAEDLQPFLITEGTVFTGKRLAALLHEEYAKEIEAERRRMEEFAVLPPLSQDHQRRAEAHLAAPTGDWGGAVRAEKTLIFESDFHALQSDTAVAAYPADPRAVPAKGTAANAEASGLSKSGVAPSERPTLGMEPSQPGALAADAARPPPQSAPAASRTGELWRGAATFFGLLGLAVGLTFVWQRYAGNDANTGTLVVTSVPTHEVTLFLDGVQVAAQTPYTRERVPLGAHRLVARAKGFRDKAYRFDLEAGDPATIPVELEREVPLVLPGEASLDIVTDPPGAAVRIGGLPQGITPLTLPHPDTANPIVLEVAKPGYVTQTVSATFAPGERKKELRLTLLSPGVPTGSPAPQPAAATQATVVVRSRPSRANVFVGGVQKGITPLVLPGLSGQGVYAIEVVHEGFRPSENIVHINGRAEVQVDATLVPLRGGAVAAAAAPDAAAPPPLRGHGCGGTGSKLSIMALDVGDCKVLVARQPLGIAPMFKKDGPVGRCPIEVRCPGNKRFSTVRLLRAGAEEKIIIKPTDWQ